MRLILNAIKSERVKIYLGGVLLCTGKLIERGGYFNVTESNQRGIQFSVREVSKVVVHQDILPEVYVQKGA